MTLPDQLNKMIDRLGAEESRELRELALILKQAIENTESAMVHHDRQIRLLEDRLKKLESE